MTKKTCQTCGAAIDTDRSSGLCPVCLLKGGLSVETVQPHELQCTKCRTPLNKHARYCTQCGAPASSVEHEGDPLRSALEEKLRGEYRVVRLLGKGGMGAVYLARDLTLEREVAVKVVTAAPDDFETYERFRREAKTAARLSHPNIVPLHTFGEVEGMPYFVMGYVRGESLATRLRREGKMTVKEGLRLIAEIADALDHAHRQGIIHRDVKPDNVLIDDESGRALLTDFGVAKALDAGKTMTRSGTVVGTPHYMSPEQIEGRSDIDGRSDIYSLGVMAYAILGGRLPFSGTPTEVLKKHLMQKPPALISLNAGLSHTSARAVERCLAKESSKRWADAKSLRLALGVSEEPQLPDALQTAEGRGIPAAVITFLFFLIYVARLRVDIQVPWLKFSFYGMFAGIAISSYLFFVHRLKRQGFSLSESQHVIWREPSWWLWWYPRSLRRKGNIWDRLPASVRYLRLSILVFIADMFVLWTLISLFGGVFFHASVATGRYGLPVSIYFGVFGLTVVAWVVFMIRARGELKRKGLPAEDANRVMMSIPTSRVSLWRKPHIMEVLAPAAQGDQGSETDSPHAYLQLILHLGDQLPGPLRPLGGKAAVAGRRLLTSIEDADREITELGRSLEVSEEECLTEKISALEGADSAPLRTLLEKELELLRGLSERLAEVQENRSRRIEMLRTLSVHLAAFRSRSTESTDTSSLTDQVRILCDEIAARVAAPRS
ncbi:MAG: protein kinase [bacterium]|nr:protein kinase [bacterium]